MYKDFPLQDFIILNSGFRFVQGSGFTESSETLVKLYLVLSFISPHLNQQKQFYTFLIFFPKMPKTSFLLIDKEYIYDEIVVSLNNVQLCLLILNSTKKKFCRYNTIQNTILSQNRGERRCSGRLSGSCSTSCPRFVNSSHFHLYLPPFISVSFHCFCDCIVLSFVFLYTFYCLYR